MRPPPRRWRRASLMWPPTSRGSIGRGQLHVGRHHHHAGHGRSQDHAAECVSTSLIANGYARLPNIDLPHMRALCDGIDTLRDLGLPAQFILAFDEAWEVVERIEGVLRPTLPRLANIHDFFVFDVPPGACGWGLPLACRPGRSLA